VADGVRFYAGALLRTPDGIPVGTLCVADRGARPDGLTPLQRLGLRTLADQVMGQMELRRVQREKQALALALRAAELARDERARAADEARGRLDALLAAAPVGIGYVDRDGARILSNTALDRLCGASPPTAGPGDVADWRGWWADGSVRHGAALAPHEWPQARGLRGERVEGDVIEIEPSGAPGARRTVVVHAAPVRAPDGSIDGAVIAVNGIGARPGE
jgi:PAS domain-containing protein